MTCIVGCPSKYEFSSSRAVYSYNRAEGEDGSGNGGAMYLPFNVPYNSSGSIFKGNWASSSGGALYYGNTDSPPIWGWISILSDRYEGNEAGEQGGALSVQNGGNKYNVNEHGVTEKLPEWTLVQNSSFVDNDVGNGDGSAIYFNKPCKKKMNMKNNMFAGNTNYDATVAHNQGKMDESHGNYCDAPTKEETRYVGDDDIESSTAIQICASANACPAPPSSSVIVFEGHELTNCK